MAKSRLSQGAKIAVSGAASPSVFTNIANVTGINESGDSRDMLEQTNLDSTAKEYVGGLIDYGTVEVSVNYDTEEATHLTLQQLLASGAERDWRITESGGGSPGTRTQFKGFIQSASRSRAVNALVTATYTIKRTGPTTEI